MLTNAWRHIVLIHVPRLIHGQNVSFFWLGKIIEMSKGVMPKKCLF